MRYESAAEITGEQGGYRGLQKKLELAKRYLDSAQQLPVTHFDYEHAPEGEYDESHIPEVDVAQELHETVPDWEVHVQEIVPNTWLEQKRAEATTAAIEHGIENPEDYETFHYKERVASGAKKVWLSFPGLQAGHEGAEKDLDKIDAHSMIPDEGVGVTFYGPSGIAGTTPEQCVECTERVFEAVKEILAKYPDYEVNVIGFSAGTHLAHYVANQLGEEVQEQVVNKMVTVSSGLGIGMGIYSTKVTEPLQQELYEQGIDKYLYTASIEGYNQLDNVEWIPKGENFRTFYSPGDKFIPPKLEGGTFDYIEFLKDQGVIEDEETSVRKVNPLGTQGDHVSVVGSIVLSKLLGYDLYGFGAPDTTPWRESDFKEQYFDIVRQRIDQLDHDQMKTLLEFYASAHNGGYVGSVGNKLPHELDDNEQSIVDILHERGLVNFVTDGRQSDYITLTKESRAEYFGDTPISKLTAFWQDERSSPRGAETMVKDLASVAHIDIGTTYKYPPQKEDEEAAVR